MQLQYNSNQSHNKYTLVDISKKKVGVVSCMHYMNMASTILTSTFTYSRNYLWWHPDQLKVAMDELNTKLALDWVKTILAM